MRVLTSSHLGQKYDQLIDKKLELATCLKKEHLMRMKLLKFDVAIKKKEFIAMGYNEMEVSLLESEDLML